MRWKDRRRSQNVEDRRGRRVGKKSIGIGGLLVAAIMAYVFGDSSLFFNQLAQQTQQVTQAPQTSNNDEAADFATVILASLEDTWQPMFKRANQHFESPKLVLYTGQVQSACGLNSSAVGPFYCPNDKKIYLDLTFLNELKRMGASGDFAFAYVIAHEYGHHISNLIGSLPKVHQYQQKVSRQDANQLSILLELQADCFAGVWGNYANKKQRMLEPGDIQEGIQAAASVGDDALIGNQPEKFTHGTSEQRMQWLTTGLKTGDVSRCDTFAQAGIKL